MKGSVRLIELNMAENGNMEEVVKTEVGENTFVGNQNEQPFALLLRVTQSNGKPLPIGGLQEEQCLRCYMKLLEKSPKR